MGPHTSQRSIFTYCLTASPTLEGSAIAKACMMSTKAVTVDSTCWNPRIKHSIAFNSTLNAVQTTFDKHNAIIFFTLTYLMKHP